MATTANGKVYITTINDEESAVLDASNVTVQGVDKIFVVEGEDGSNEHHYPLVTDSQHVYHTVFDKKYTLKEELDRIDLYFEQGINVGFEDTPDKYLLESESK